MVPKQFALAWRKGDKTHNGGARCLDAQCMHSACILLPLEIGLHVAACRMVGLQTSCRNVRERKHAGGPVAGGECYKMPTMQLVFVQKHLPG